MDQHSGRDGIDRRLMLGAGASALIAMPRLAQAQQSAPAPSATGAAPAAPETVGSGKALSRVIGEYAAGFELKAVPPEVIDRARVAFIDTIGVMLAGSRQDVSGIACDMVKAESSVPSATVVGQSLRASPQLAALANGVATHAMDYDLTFLSGQAVAPVIERTRCAGIAARLLQESC